MKDEYVTIRIPREKMGRPSKCPSATELSKLYKEHSRKELADWYGVAESTVARWLKNAKVRKYGS